MVTPIDTAQRHDGETGRMAGGAQQGRVMKEGREKISGHLVNS